MLGSEGDLQKAITPAVTAEVIWELREDTWHLDLMALDQALPPKFWLPASEGLVDSSETLHTQLRREMVLRQALPARGGEDLGEIFVTKIPNVDRGLASYHWSNHHGYLVALGELMLSWHGYLVALRELMLSWHGYPETIINADIARVELVSRKLERLVIKYYCESFFDTLSSTLYVWY